MYCINRIRNILVHNISWKQSVMCTVIINIQSCKVTKKSTFKYFYTSNWLCEKNIIPKPLRNTKSKPQCDSERSIVDLKQVRAIGGKGGNGGISFLQLWSNECAGPDGGDGGNGGHIIYQATINVKDLSHIPSFLKAEDGEDGQSKNCYGKNAKHSIIQVPIGTIVRNAEGKIVADLNQEGMMFIAARGGSGGHGNSYFKSDVQQAPTISEYGAIGENLQYVLEISSMADIGLIGLPNAGKSTLLRAISRARPKVAAYPFTTMRPHLGMVLYDDYEQIAVADLPGIIAGSHRNKGLGIKFLKHIERCKILLFILDVTSDEPWTDFETLKHEVTQFNVRLNKRLVLIVANKTDIPGSTKNLEILREKIDLPIIPISAKNGTNLSTLLEKLRILYDKEGEETVLCQENFNSN